MTSIPFGRAVSLVTEKAGADARRKVGLEAIEGGTGRLLATDAEYSGDGVAFTRGDVLFGKLRPYLAKSWLADGDGAAVGDFHVYRPVHQRADGRYIQYATLSRAFLDPVVSSVYGAKMPRASWDFVRQVELYLPGIHEQRAIAAYLDRETAQIDTLIAKQERLIATLRERARSEVEVAMVASGAPLVPLRRVASVIDCAHVTAEFVDDDRRYPVASIRECQGPVVDLSACNYTTRESFDVLRGAGRAPEVGDLLFIRNVSVGLVSEVTGDLPPFAVGQETVLLRPEPGILPTYLRYALTSPRASHDVNAAMIGSTFRRINVSAIRGLPVPLAAERDQQRLVSYLEERLQEIDTLIAKAERFIELAKERRAALITAAVTGQIDVRAA